MTVYFSAIGSGLGDIIVSLPILQQLISTGEPIYLIAKSPRQENLEFLLPGLAGTIREPDFDENALDGRHYNFRAHPLQRDYIWGNSEFEAAFPGIRINDILELICRDFGITIDLHKPLQPLPYRLSHAWSETIVFVPGTVTDTKSWPVSHWLQLNCDLQQRSQRVLMIGEPERASTVQQLLEGGIPWTPTPTVASLLDIISNCKAVVSVDTGIMHISVNQGKPTIALFENYALYHRNYSNCWPLFAKVCPKECSDAMAKTADRAAKEKRWAWYDGKFERCLVAEELKCMSSITTVQVLSSLNQALNQVPAKPLI